MTKQNNDTNVTKIYLVENCYGDPNKVYIGKTKTSRKSAHIKTYGSQIEYTYIDKINSLKHEEWEPLETFWMEYFKFLGFELMNIRKKGGSGSECWSEEAKKRIRISRIGRKISEETKLKIGKANKGRKYSDEAKLKISNSHLGNTYKKGKKLSDESKLKISIAKKGRPRSDSFRINRSKPVIQYDLQGNFIKEWIGAKQAMKELKINNIHSCTNNRHKTAGGFIWKFKE
jgi:hypothetical protein